MTESAVGAVRRGLPERHPWRCLALCLAVAALVAVLAGQDACWDLKNYHLYNAWAWLHGRGRFDLAAAGMQSYFSPYLDLPYALLALGPLKHWPRLLTAVQGLYAGLAFYMVWAIQAVTARCRGARMDGADAAAVLIGVSGSALGSQIGTTTNEMQLAVLVLAALLVLLKAIADQRLSSPQGWRSPVLAGLLVGAAAGLKPTAVVYVPALAFGLFLAVGGRRGRRAGGLCLLAAGVAFLACYGAWGWHLWRLTGSPIFPLFNGVFHSDWTTVSGHTDRRFLPHGLLQWLFYPFDWGFKRGFVVTEERMRDPRLAFAYMALLGLALLAWRRRRRRPLPAAEASAHRLLTVFMIAAYAIWLALFSIYRYAIAIEALSGWAIMLAWRRLMDARGAGHLARRSGIVVLTLLMLAGTHYPRWGRTAYAADVFEVHPPPLPAHSLVVFVGQPLAYLAPFFRGDDLRFAGVTWLTMESRGHRLWSLSRRLIVDNPGPVYAVLRERADGKPEMPATRRALRALGLPRLSARQACRPLIANLEHDRLGRQVGPVPYLCSLRGDRSAQPPSR